MGTGGGYGESIIVHLGNGDWIVIDSCLDPNSRECLPLNFLKERKIELTSIKLIICTHWHDDHIGGLSKLLENCTEAKFSLARVNDLRKFLNFVSLDFEMEKSVASNSSTVEFNRCLEIAQKRKMTIKYASCDRFLYSTKLGDLDIDVYSLSPSDKSSELFDKEISRLITEFGNINRKLPKYSPNDRSVVILIKFGKDVALFGADLEVKDDPNLGWHDIVENSEIAKKFDKAKYFKIPHHGSENGYHETIWDHLVDKHPIGTLTPWNKNNKLPKEEMILKYKTLTSKLFITSASTLDGRKPKKRDNKVEKVIKEFNSTLREIKFKYGLVSVEFEIGKSDQCRVNLGGAAVEL
jgi:hypothetical protein